MVDLLQFSLTCLCFSGININLLIAIAMAVGLFRYIEVIKDDKLFKALFVGTLFLVVSQIISAYHSSYSNLNPSVWVPAIQAYVISFELAAYVLIFGSIQEYFRRFADNL